MSDSVGKNIRNSVPWKYTTAAEKLMLVAAFALWLIALFSGCERDCVVDLREGIPDCTTGKCIHFDGEQMVYGECR